LGNRRKEVHFEFGSNSAKEIRTSFRRLLQMGFGVGALDVRSFFWRDDDHEDELSRVAEFVCHVEWRRGGDCCAGDWARDAV
jgi:hypothetical protein